MSGRSRDTLSSRPGAFVAASGVYFATRKTSTQVKLAEVDKKKQLSAALALERQTINLKSLRRRSEAAHAHFDVHGEMLLLYVHTSAEEPAIVILTFDIPEIGLDSITSA